MDVNTDGKCPESEPKSKAMALVDGTCQIKSPIKNSTGIRRWGFKVGQGDAEKENL